MLILPDMPDFPVNEKTQCTAQKDDCADGGDFPQITDDDRAEDFTAELELKAERQRTRQIEADVDSLAGEIQNKIPHGAEENDDHAHRFKQMDDHRDGGVKQVFEHGGFPPFRDSMCSAGKGY